MLDFIGSKIILENQNSIERELLCLQCIFLSSKSYIIIIQAIMNNSYSEVLVEL
jgi:hypothetical protein